MQFRGKLALLGIQLLVVLGAAAPAASAATGGGVLVVGDSLEELTSPYLQRHLPGVPLTINAVGGYNSFQIYDLFAASYDPDRHTVIVFDAGTNDNPNYPQILAGNLRKVAAAVGDRCMVVPTIHGLSVEGTGNEGKNAVVAAFAASRPGTETPDWAGVATTRPDLMQADDLHPTAEGAEYRAQLIAQGVLGCLAPTGAWAGAPSLPGSAPAAASSAEVTDPKPRLDPVGRVANRQAEVFAAIGAGVARRLLGRIVGGDA